MKKCSYCAEEIQDDAVKCKYCGEWMKKESGSALLVLNSKWWYRFFSSCLCGFIFNN